jgi:SAM-dependent methyltransferase
MPPIEQPREFYDQLASDYHLIFADWHASMRRQAAALDQLIRAALGDGPLTILDASCGIGTQAIGLAERGYRVHATDVSSAAVERASVEAAARGVALSVGVADLRTLDRQVDGQFDVVLSCDNSLPHLLSDADLRQAARGLWTKLRPGGLLLASIRDYDRILRERPGAELPRVFDDATGRRIVFQVWDWEADGETYQLHLFLLRETAGGWSTKHHATRYRALRRAGLGALLREAGLARVRWHQPEASGYYQPIVTARRPASPRRVRGSGAA